MDLLVLISWLGPITSGLTSIVRASNIGYQQYTYIVSFLSTLASLYTAYQIGSNPFMFQSVLYLFINLMGIYKWSNKDKDT